MSCILMFFRLVLLQVLIVFGIYFAWMNVPIRDVQVIVLVSGLIFPIYNLISLYVVRKGDPRGFELSYPEKYSGTVYHLKDVLSLLKRCNWVFLFVVLLVLGMWAAQYYWDVYSSYFTFLQ